MKKRNKKSRILRFFAILLLTPILLIGLAIVLLYIPAVQNYVIKETCRIIDEKSDYRLTVGSFRLALPFKISINDFNLSSDEENIVNGEQLEIDIRIAPLFKGEIEVNYVSIDNTLLHTGEMIEGVSIDGEIGHFRTTARSINIDEKIADVSHLHMSDSYVKIAITESDEKEDTTESKTDWIIKLRKGNIDDSRLALAVSADTMNITATLDNLSVRNATVDLGNEEYNLGLLSLRETDVTYDVGSESDSIAPLDHLQFNNINIETGSIYYCLPRLKADIKNITLQQPDGLEIEKFRLYAIADDENIDISNFRVESANGTLIKATTSIPWKMLNGADGGKMRGEISAHIDKRDTRGFITHEQYANLSALPDSLLNLTALLNGNMQKTVIDTIRAEIPHVATIAGNGTMRNINNDEKRKIDINLRAVLSDINNVISATEQPDSLSRQKIFLNGEISINGNECNAIAAVRAQKSKADIKASYDLKNSIYNAWLNIDSMNIANILPSVPVKTLAMQMNLKGEGTDIFSDSTSYSCNITIDSIRYDAYTLQNIDLAAEQAERKISLLLNSDDPDLQMQLSGNAILDTTAIDGSMQMNVKHANLTGIGIEDAPIIAQMNISAKAFSDMKQTHKLQIAGDDFKLITKERTFTPARMEFDGMTSPDTSYVTLNNGDLHILGTLDNGYNGLIKAFEKIERMFEKARHNENMIYFAQDYEKELPTLSVDVDCGPNNILANFMAYNKFVFDSFELHCNLDSVNGIKANSGLYGLKHEKMRLDTIRVFANQEENRIRYFAGIRTTGLDPAQEKQTFNAALYGDIENDSLKTNFIFRDNRERPAMQFALNTHMMPEGLNLHFDPDAILFGNRFSFNKDNYLELRKNLAIQGNIELTNGNDAGIHLYTTPDSTQLQSIMLTLFNADLLAITKMLPFAPEIGGILNADIHYRNGNDGMLVVGDIQGSEISYEGTLLGDETVEITYIPDGANKHYVDVAAYHNNEQIINLYGDYIENREGETLIGDLSLTHFPLKLSEAFIKESGLSFTGYIDGEVSINGTVENINAGGFIRFDSVYADAPMFGTRLHLKDDRVNIVDNKLIFDNFDIYATGDSPFKINGNIDMHNLSNPIFDLRMRASNYELINAQRKKGTMLYGRMLLDINTFINGSLNSLRLYGNATLLGNSNITYVLQDTPLAADNELDGLVEFVNFEDTTKSVVTEKEVDFGNLDMNMTLRVEEGARINADIDENRNSYIELQGEGLLNLTYTSQAGINLTGRYTLSNGQMKYSLPIIPLKTFSISDGSYINWTGDIMNPQLHITALERMTSAVTFEDGNSQAVAFDVGVILTNRLSDMGLSFTLSAPENATVQNELNSVDQETLNKYAVTMLITGAYLGNNGALTVSGAISSFLDAKINDLAGNAMKSVSVNVGITDIENAETGNTYKNYSFSFSKRFWNDRLTVVIGGEVNSGEHNQSNESFINNVSLEWKVSNSGNRYIRLFYDKNYESVLEGEIIETGIGYVYKRKVNNLNELLIFRKKDDDDDERSTNNNN